MIKVIDLYSGNPRDFEEALNGTFAGVIFKGGQGDWLDVPKIQPDWWKIAGDNGLLRGHYWVCDSRYHSSKHIDAINRWRDDWKIDLNAELGFWSDVEFPYMSCTVEEYWRTPYAGHKNVVDFHYLMEVNGIIAGLYSGDVYNEIMKNASSADHDYLARFRMWPANYPFIYIPGVSKPRMFGHWKAWVFWQYHGNPDYSVFNGTDEQFYELFGAAPIPPEPPTGGDMQVKALTDVRVRANHNTAATILGYLYFGQVSDVLETWSFGTPGGQDYEQWARISAGWVAVWYRTQGKLCELTGTIPQPPATERTVTITVQDGALSGSATITLK